MRIRRVSFAASAAAVLLAAGLIAGPSVLRAQDKPPAGKGDGGAAKGGDAKNAPAPVEKRLDRAKRLVAELETTIAVLKAAKTVDAESMKALERALEEARKLAQPITAEELSDEEKKNLTEKLKPAGDDRQGPPRGPGEDFREDVYASAFKDADLTESEQVAAKKVIDETGPKIRNAWTARDSKALSDAKRERDDALEKALGRKKAQKVINNLNALWPGRR